MFDIGFQGIAIQGPFDHHRGLHAAQGNRSDDGDVGAAFFEAFVDHGALAARGTGVRASHIQMDAELIKKPEATRRERGLQGLKGRAFLRVGFGGAACFF